jgi:hypothetical protein
MSDLFTINGNTPAVLDIASQYGIPPRTGDGYYGVGSSISANVGDYLQVSLPAGLTEIYFGFAVYAPSGVNAAPANSQPNLIYFPTSDTILRLNGNTGQIQSGYNSGNPTVLASASFAFNQWNYVEGHIILSTSTGGTFTVKVNGTQVLNSTGARTAQVAGNFDTARFYSLNGSASYSYMLYDDIVFNSTAGGAPNNTWPGQVRLFPMRVRGAGDLAQWSRAGMDLNTNQGQVREAGSGVSYLQSGTASQEDLEAMDAPQLPAGSTIVQVIVDVHCRAQAGGSNITPELKSGSTSSLGTSTVIGTTWQSVQNLWTTDPATAVAWVQSGLASVQMGVKLA